MLKGVEVHVLHPPVRLLHDLLIETAQQVQLLYGHGLGAEYGDAIEDLFGGAHVVGIVPLDGLR